MDADEHQVPGGLIFVYEFGGDTRPASCQTVTLTPSAAAECLLAGLKPLSVDDYVDRQALLVSRQREYLRWQLDWLRRLTEVPGVPSAAGRAAFGYLKNPMDSVVAWSRLLRETIRIAEPAEVTYVGPAVSDEPEPWHGNHMQFWPKLGDRPLADRLLPLVCAHAGVGLRTKYWQAPRVAVGFDGTFGLRARVREGLVVAYNFWPAGSFRHRGDASVLLWPSSYGARAVARSEKDRHRRVLLLDRRQPAPALIQALPAGNRRLSQAVDGRLPATTLPLSAELLGLLDELDRWTGIPQAGRVLESRLATYVNRICPTVERIARQVEPALRREEVVAVIASNPYALVEYGCLLGASRISGLERSLVQHGQHAFPYDFWLATETQNFDRLVCSDQTLPADLTEAAQDLGCPIPTFDVSSPHHEPRVRRINRTTRGQRALICYLPTIYTGDALLLGGSGFEDTWYFRWQRALLQIMVEHPGFTFVWKALPQSSYSTADPLIAAIGRARNVQYETTPFPVLAPRMAAMITDFSSTGLYEALALGLPALALSFTRFEVIRPRAREALGPVLHSCQDIGEASAAVREFLTGMLRPTAP